MIGLSFIPATNIGGVNIKQINILSDVITNNDLRGFFGLKPVNTFEKTDSIVLEDIDNAIDSIEAMNNEAAKTPYTTTSYTTTNIVNKKDSLTTIVKDTINISKVISKTLPDTIIPIEDYSENYFSLISFYENLDMSTTGKSVRIAFMGDSYIEGDILTCDLRNMYQRKYSGNGVGFVPIYSQVSKFRKTIDNQSSGWTQHSIIKESKRNDYIISKYSFTPSENAVTEYKINKFKSCKSSVQRATFIFRNSKNTTVDILVNGDKKQNIIPNKAENLQYIHSVDSISRIKYNVSNIDGFTGYGVYLNDTTGVYVDNYAVRGSSGVFIALLNESLCKDLNEIVPVNLIILQYGLNIANGNASNFQAYKRQMTGVINKLKTTFIDVPILLMGVPDQSIKKDNEYVSNPSVALLDDFQREIAKETKIAFWSTLKAVKTLGGMSNMVKLNMAAKDFTHINATGGEKIAAKLFESMEYYKNNYKK